MAMYLYVGKTPARSYLHMYEDDVRAEKRGLVTGMYVQILHAKKREISLSIKWHCLCDKVSLVSLVSLPQPKLTNPPPIDGCSPQAI